MLITMKHPILAPNHITTITTKETITIESNIQLLNNTKTETIKPKVVLHKRSINKKQSDLIINGYPVIQQHHNNNKHTKSNNQSKINNNIKNSSIINGQYNTQTPL